MKREEIVELLRGAALTEKANALACCSGILPVRFKEEHNSRATILDKATAQVENMRCDTCAKGLDYEINVKVSIGSYTCKTPCPWRGCGGCFQHEPKVK